MARLRTALVAVAALAAACGLAQGQDARPAASAILIDIDGAIGPATTDHVRSGLERAARQGASLVVLRLDTPGGLDSSTREIIAAILSSPVPVVTYVAPTGARAASAGTYILYASHVAAMAPSTHLGAATPVAIGGGGMPFGGGQEEDDDGNTEGSARTPGSAQEAKAINDAVAYIRGLAEMRGRNADWAERAVREAATLTASSASRENVIDFTATSIEDLLDKAHGMTVQVGQSETVLESRGLTIDV